MNIIIILIIIIIIFVLSNKPMNTEYYSNVDNEITKKYPPYYYFYNPFYISNGIPYIYHDYYYPKYDDHRYYIPSPLNMGYFAEQNAHNNQ